MVKSSLEKWPGSVRELPAVPARFARCDHSLPTSAKKTDVSEHPAVFDHVGLLVNRPTGTAGLPFT